MPTVRKVLVALLVAGITGVVALALLFHQAMRRAEARVAAPLSHVMATQHGALEYSEAGRGAPLLMIHGTGGGFDQGLAFAQPLTAMGYRVIAPSRFGYLRSGFPADHSAAAQADALVELLDALGIEKAAIAGGSAGAIPALVFAARHPDRTAALLLLVPALPEPGAPPPEPWSPFQAKVALAVVKSDFLFWLGITFAPDLMTRTLLATAPALVKAAAPQERARVSAILQGILPVSVRASGFMNDARETNTPVDFEYRGVSAPTLAVSLQDDAFGTARGARHAAAQIAGAELVIYPSGGHVWVGRNAELFAAIGSFLQRHGYPP